MPKRVIELINELIEEHGFALETDNDGQIVLYTGLMFDENDNIVELEIKDAEARD